MIDGRPCVLGSAFAVYFFILKLFFGLRMEIERLELDVSFSGHCARRKKRLEAEEARQTVTKRVTTNGVSSSGSMIPEHGKSFSLLLCHYALLVFVVVFFSLLHHRSSSFWANREFSC